MRRCVIDNLGRFRISRPGFDVDTAAPQNMLLHESFLYSQPFLFRFVACPYGGTVSGNRDQPSSPISFSNPGTQLPSVAIFIVSSDSLVDFPARNALSTPQTGGVVSVPTWYTTYSLTNSSITLRFFTSTNTPAPLGAYIILFKRG